MKKLKEYWFCRIFGHKFFEVQTVEGAPGYNEVPEGYTATKFIKRDYCTKCGLTKQEIQENV